MRPDRRLWFWIGVLIWGAQPLGGQTPITSVGLGYPVEPVDGRSAALGGTGIGLLGGTFSLRSPADLLLHAEPGFGMSFSGEAVTVEGEDGSLDTGRERFTTIRALVPFGDWAVAFGFGSEFDQDWSVRFQDTLVLADGSVPFEEAREHDGGISSIDLSVARRLGPLGVGVSAQRLTGSLRQTFFRAFGLPLGTAPVLAGIADGQEVAYRAWRFKAGASIAVSDRFVVSGSFGLGGTLHATVLDGDGSDAEFDLPTTLEIGGSARLSDRLLVTAAGGWGGWSVVTPRDGGPGSAFTSHDVNWMGGGIEYRGLSLLGGGLPIRFGARRADLPFSLGAEGLDESAITGGFGWEFQDGLAVLDLSFEAGRRGDLASQGLEESFQRMTLSFTLRQRRR